VLWSPQRARELTGLSELTVKYVMSVTAILWHKGRLERPLYVHESNSINSFHMSMPYENAYPTTLFKLAK